MHNTHASFGQSYKLTYNFQINHTIHVNILYTHILKSTSHHQSSNDLHYTQGLIVTPCPQIAYNQAMHVDPRFLACVPTRMARLAFCVIGKPFKKMVWSRHFVNLRFSACVPTRMARLAFCVIGKPFKKNGLESPLIFVLF